MGLIAREEIDGCKNSEHKWSGHYGRKGYLYSCRGYDSIRRDRIIVKLGVCRALVGIIFKKNLYGHRDVIEYRD